MRVVRRKQRDLSKMREQAGSGGERSWGLGRFWRRAWVAGVIARTAGGRCPAFQRQVIYLSEINDSQKAVGLRARAPGPNARQALEKMGRNQIMIVHFPTTDGTELVFVRHKQTERDQQL